MRYTYLPKDGDVLDVLAQLESMTLRDIARVVFDRHMRASGIDSYEDIIPRVERRLHRLCREGKVERTRGRFRRCAVQP